MFGLAPFSRRYLMKEGVLSEMSRRDIVSSVLPLSSWQLTFTLGKLRSFFTMPSWFLSIAMFIGVIFQEFAALTSAPVFISKSIHSDHPNAAA